MEIKLNHSIEEEIRFRENIMESNQVKKRNCFLDFLTNYTHMYPIPTQNVNLINVHEKNKSMQSRLEALQKTSKEMMLKNLQINTRTETEKRQLKKRIDNFERLTQE